MESIDWTETMNKESAHNQNRAGKTAVGRIACILNYYLWPVYTWQMTKQDKVDHGPDDHINQWQKENKKT